MKHLFANGAYDRLTLMDKADHLDLVIKVIPCNDNQQGVKVLPRRWAVERALGSMIRWRPHVRDSEKRIDVSQTMILVAMGANMLR